VKQLLALTFLPLAVEAQQPMVPVLNQLIPDVVLVAGESGETFTLSEHFGMETVRDEAVRLTAEWTLVDGTVKTADLDFLLFEDRTPITRDNFLGYVNRGDYTDMVVHRVVPGFVIQGGGFIIENDDDGSPFSSNVTTQPPIQNEFGVSNTLGTISMAKLGGDPDSATSQWFISTGANSDNLDFQNGGFTVFGRVSRESFPRALELDRLEDFQLFNLGGAFSDTPLVEGTTNPTFTAERFYRFQSATEIPLPPGQATSDSTLSYSFEEDFDGEESEIRVENGELILNVIPGVTGGRKEVVLKATDAVGNEVVDSFEVLVEIGYEAWRQEAFSPADAADDSVSGPMADPNGDGVNNLTLFAQGLPVDLPLVARTPEIVSAGNSVVLEMETPYRQGLNLVVEVSDGLTGWAEVAATQTTRSGRYSKTEIFRVARPVGANPKSFYRIHYSLD
jgi:cyclophilin family peptidyl-prolyl cis-trans isomerase